MFRLFIFVCFAPNSVINDVPASVTSDAVTFPTAVMYPFVFKSPDAATVKKAH